VAASACFCGLAYLNVTSDGRVVFNWFINITNTGGMTSWICCCIIYFRFRKATDAQGVDRPYKSFIQPYGAYVALVFFSITLLTNGFAVFWPGRWSTNTFLTSYVGIPIFLALYLGHRLLNWEQKWAHDPLEVDLHTGLAELIEAETPPVKRTGWKVVMRVIE
jgi:amino acid transporter